MSSKMFRAIVLSLSFFFSFQLLAQPYQCLDEYGNPLAVSNESALIVKFQYPNGTKVRARVKGPMIRVTGPKRKHVKFAIQIGPNTEDTLEVIYNRKFGDLEEVQVGDVVEACGDLIVSNKRRGRYYPSPEGAIIHWLHFDPRGKHKDGYLKVNQHDYGIDGTFL